jgi:hypothetical protein
MPCDESQETPLASVAILTADEASNESVGAVRVRGAERTLQLGTVFGTLTFFRALR